MLNYTVISYKKNFDKKSLSYYLLFDTSKEKFDCIIFLIENTKMEV